MVIHNEVDVVVVVVVEQAQDPIAILGRPKAVKTPTCTAIKKIIISCDRPICYFQVYSLTSGARTGPLYVE